MFGSKIRRILYGNYLAIYYYIMLEIIDQLEFLGMGSMLELSLLYKCICFQLENGLNNQ